MPSVHFYALQRLCVLVVADYGALRYQLQLHKMRGRTLKYATKPAITYTRCYAP